MSDLPKPSEILPIPVKLARHKVWKHFYDPQERWDVLCELDIDAARHDAERVSGQKWMVVRELPTLYGVILTNTSELLDRHHEEGYRPAYTNALLNSGSHWARQVDGKPICLSPDFVFLLVGKDTKGRNPDADCVLTAYRPTPKDCLKFDESRRRKHANRYFGKKSKGHRMNFRETILHDLKTETPISTAADVWLLAYAIGYGEALLPDESLTRALLEARERLETIPQALRAQVVESLVWDGRKQAVIKAIEDEDPNDLNEALDHVEDLLAVARALDLREQVDHFVEELDPVLAWISAEMFPALIPFVDANLERYVENVPLGRLWRNLQGHAWRSILQTTAPVDASAEAFMASMFSEPWYIRLANQIRARATDVAKTVLSELEKTVKSASFLPLQPKLGVSTKFAIKMRQWHDQSHHARLFVVDAGYPEGYEVTDDWLNGPTIWEYESDLDLVLLVGTSPIPGEKLVDCLSYASQREDIWVQYRHMSRNPDHVA
ncbi:hypothetical protein FRD01_22525 [Microvenator marinus]|uniref:Uncharacterized protein n=1 Tax=Microvenator marinus TaxID=2600177 RepID=A0A5B8XWN1_9DELT|nr:hypothetical protein [Microvenator marinus]QED29960.1 hypothetical protein FRD01_22525 [Microvenator marinus]